MNNIPMRLRIMIGLAVVMIPLAVWQVVASRSDAPRNLTAEQAAIREDRINGNVQGLAEKVKTYKPQDARRATDAIGKIRHRKSMLPLKLILQEDKRPEVKEQAAYAIADVVEAIAPAKKPLPKEMTVDLVTAMKKEKAPTVRAAAASALGRLYDYNNMDSLLQAMDDEDLGVRISAHSAVSRIFGRKYKFDAHLPSAKRQIVIRGIAADWKVYKSKVGTYHDANREPAKP